MKAQFLSVTQKLKWPVAAAAVYFVLAMGAVDLAMDRAGVPIFWPASGFFLAALLLTRESSRTPVYLAVGAASLLASLMVGADIGKAVAYTLAYMAQAFVAVGIVSSGGSKTVSFSDPRYVGRFAAAAFVAGFAGAAVACLADGVFSVAFFGAWASTVTLGMMIGAPLTITLWRIVRIGPDRILPSQFIGGSLAVGLVTACALVAFGLGESYPLLFLPPVAVLFATYLLGSFGASLSVFIVALVASVATARGYGPITMVPMPVLFLQFYLLVQLAAALPLVVLLGMRNRHIAEIERSNNLLGAAERIAQMGHWRFDPSTEQLFWSREVLRIHGMPLDSQPSLEEAIEAHHPIDRIVVQEALEKALATNTPFDYEVRIVRPDGEIRQIHVRGETQIDKHGQTASIFGMVQDVTERVQATVELQIARREAEAETLRAERLAETDQLTGLANRRKAMAVFEVEIERAYRHAGNLSVAMMDIDHFKSINDTFGHAVGDDVLKKVAGLCKEALRKTDYIGRIGGEEFLLIIPHADSDGAMAVAERVRESIERAEWEALGLPAVTVSIGLASYKKGIDQHVMLKEADEALYEAKRSGRNRLLKAA